MANPDRGRGRGGFSGRSRGRGGRGSKSHHHNSGWVISYFPFATFTNQVSQLKQLIFALLNRTKLMDQVPPRTMPSPRMAKMMGVWNILIKGMAPYTPQCSHKTHGQVSWQPSRSHILTIKLCIEKVVRLAHVCYCLLN